MKKIIVSLLILVVCLLSSCQLDDEQITILVQKGVSEIAQVKIDYYYYEGDRFDITIAEDDAEIEQAFLDDTYDVIYAPTVLGARMYNTEPNYMLISIITWAGLYLVHPSDSSTIKFDDIDGKEIVIALDNDEQDFLLNYLIDNNTWIEEPILTYVDTEDEVVSRVSEDPTLYGMLSCYSMLNAESSIDNLSFVDVMAEWDEVTTKTVFPMQCVFAKTNSNIVLILDYVDYVSSSMDLSFDDINDAYTKSVFNEYSFSMEEYSSIVKYAGYDYKYVKQYRTCIDIYLDLVLNYDSSLLNEKMTDKDFYSTFVVNETEDSY